MPVRLRLRGPPKGKPKGNMTKQSKYTKELLRTAVKESFSIAGVLRNLDIGFSGGMHSYISNLVDYYNLDTSHFKSAVQHLQKHAFRTRVLTPDEILVKGRSLAGEKRHILHRVLQQVGVPYHCGICGISSWQDKLLKLHIDHIDGNHSDNSRENLRYVCPNCHSQTPTYAMAKAWLK